jgi:GTP-binding protein LepA
MDNALLIRNFAIIAHVDHGKSTLADRLLELTGTVEKGKHDEQMLDRNPISRERGITIKLAPVRMEYGKWKMGMETGNFQIPNSLLNPTSYILNLIDTPGHVDFSYEVDRTLACVEGVVLLVDATQGVQAQTIANAYKAIEKNLVIIPAVNKIDLPNAQVSETKKQLIAFLGGRDEEIFCISAKTGEGVKELLEKIIEKIPNPNVRNDSRVGPNTKPLQALIFDSYYDAHRGVIAFVRVFEGEIKKNQQVRLVNLGTAFAVNEVGYFTPDLKATEILSAGEIGYIVTNLKDIHQVRVGDTLTDEKNPLPSLPGYRQIQPMVYASIFPTDTADFLNLKKSLEKLYLNDSSLVFNSIHSKAFGAGFRVGFLGLLHADIVRERLEREFNLDLVLTPPQVEFKLENNCFYEPYVKLLIVTPQKFLGNVMRLVEDYRGQFLTMDNKTQISISYIMPMSEMISDFYDKLKSVSAGYASLDWEFLEYRKVDAHRLVVLLNGQEVNEFSEVVVKERAMEKGQALVKRLRSIVPRQQYEVKIQAQYKGKIIASERISPFRKNVLMKSGKVLGTGDVGRKKKLLEKQKEGKKKMKMIGSVEIPKEAFVKLFNRR